MAKLTDTQSILLSTASQRADGNLLPAPDTLGASVDQISKAVARLIKLAYASEATVTAADQAFRRDGEQHYGAAITDTGRIAIGVEPISEKASVETAKEPAPEDPMPRPTKAALVLSLLQRAKGATLAELVDATGWLPHTTRAALTGLRKTGHAVAKGKRGDVTCYTLAA